MRADRGFRVGNSGSGLGSKMAGSSTAWDGELVCRWLDSRLQASRLDQASADKRGYEAQDDYDKAAAEEWVCRTIRAAGRTQDQAVVTEYLRELLAQDEYRVTGIQSDQRFERYVRANLKKLAKMTKADEGFANTLRYQS
jgi:hypothetical protein